MQSITVQHRYLTSVDLYTLKDSEFVLVEAIDGSTKKHNHSTITYNEKKPHLLLHQQPHHSVVEILSCRDKLEKHLAPLRDTLQYAIRSRVGKNLPINVKDAEVEEIAYAELTNSWFELEEGLNILPFCNTGIRSEFVVIVDEGEVIYESSIWGKCTVPFPRNEFNELIAKGESARDALDLVLVSAAI